jgi:hypothetical protein
MEIKKVAHLAQSDVETLVAAGKILREIVDGLDTKAIDELSNDSINLLKAVKEVLTQINLD